MHSDRQSRIEMLAGDGERLELQQELGPHPTQSELDSALENALAYSRIYVAKFLIAMGADIQHGHCQGAYYAVHNNEIEGTRFALENGVDVNIGNGMLLVQAVITAHNEKDHRLLNLLLDHGADINRVSDEGLRTIRAFSTSQINQLLRKT